MALQPLDEVRRALSSAWDLTRAGFWWRTAEAAADAGDWATAATRLLHLADPLDATPTGAAAWRQLAVATFDAALRARSSDLVTAASAQLLGRSWEAADRLDDLVGVFETAERLDAVAEGRTLARIVRQRYANSAWASYAAGHFDERAGLAGLAQPSASRLVEQFERAADLFESFGQRRESQHAKLRAAVARMAFSTQYDAGRAALREVAVDVAPNDRFWLAFGQLHSPFWLDRVRAADWAVDEIEDTHGEGPRAERARQLARRLIQGLPVSIGDAEADRITALGAQLDGEMRWEIEAQLRGRAAAQLVADTPLSGIDRATAVTLEQEALPLDGFAALVDAWQGRDPVSTPQNDVMREVVSVLVAARTETVADEVRALAAVVRDADDARSLRPVLLVLLRVAPRDNEADLSAALTELSLHYAQRAPTPSCGFLAVAKTLFEAGHHRAGATLTRRALDDGDRDDGTCVARSIAWAAREGSDREMLAWLEVGERELA